MKEDLLAYWSKKLSAVSSDLSHAVCEKGVSSYDEEYQELFNEITMISNTIALLANVEE